MPDFHVLGMGAMGTLASYRLMQAGLTVCSLSKHHRQPTVHRQLVMAGGEPVSLAIPAVQALPEASITRLLVATKGGDTQDALTAWLPALSPDCDIICLQNGIHTLRGAALPERARITSWITTDGAWKAEEQVNWVADNASWIGDGTKNVPAWFVPLKSRWPNLNWVPDIAWHQWRKLAVNAVINPLTALYRCRNGALLENDDYRNRMKQLALEVDSVARRKFPEWPMDTLKRSIQVCEQTAENRSSMLVDVESGRTTEIAYINGALIDEAQLFGIDLPAHRDLIALPVFAYR